jgi:recombination protein RecR
MSYSLPNSLRRLIDEFRKLPGIGEKSATRIVYHYLKKSTIDLDKIAGIFLEVGESIVDCNTCFNYTDNADGVCDICKDENRDHKQIMVLEQPFDIFTVEDGGFYNGLYHILRGSISPINGIGPVDLTLGNLLRRVEKIDSQVEIIIATSTNLEGEATSNYIQNILNKQENITISTLARGLPSGAEIDYADKTTIANAFRGRNNINSQS